MNWCSYGQYLQDMQLGGSNTSTDYNIGCIIQCILSYHYNIVVTI